MLKVDESLERKELVEMEYQALQHPVSAVQSSFLCLSPERPAQSRCLCGAAK